MSRTTGSLLPSGLRLLAHHALPWQPQLRIKASGRTWPSGALRRTCRLLSSRAQAASVAASQGVGRGGSPGRRGQEGRGIAGVAWRLPSWLPGARTGTLPLSAPPPPPTTQPQRQAGGERRCRQGALRRRALFGPGGLPSWTAAPAGRSAMSGEVRHALLRRDALSAAKEALYHLDVLVSGQLQSAAALPAGDAGPVELLEEFVFQALQERGGAQPKRLTAVQELQLLETLCGYFQEQSKEAVRQVVFSALFAPQGNKADDSRMALLGKLVSVAVAVGRVPVLECVASWLQHTPAVFCVRLARALVDDYCSLGPGSVQTLQHIFSASPRFCCQFITAVAMLYDLSSDDLIPSPDLLKMVVSWIFEDPRLILITFLNTPIVTSPPVGFLELTPLCGLICWCVKAPLAYKRQKLPHSNGALGGKMDLLDSFDRDCHLLYSKLHLSILQVLMLLQGHLTEKNLYGRLGLVTGEQMASLVEDVRLLSDKLNPLHAAKEIELALDRLAQVLQVAMASGVLLWTRENLRTVCSGLPHNNLLQLVISGPVQPPAHAALPPGFYPPIHTPPLGYPAHAALPPHPVQAFMPGMAFPYRPIR